MIGADSIAITHDPGNRFPLHHGVPDEVPLSHDNPLSGGVSRCLFRDTRGRSNTNRPDLADKPSHSIQAVTERGATSSDSFLCHLV